MNRPGGVGRVVKLNDDGTINVKYLLGGSDKNLGLQYVRLHTVAGANVATAPDLRDYNGNEVSKGDVVSIHGSTGDIAGTGVIIGRNRYAQPRAFNAANSLSLAHVFAT